MHDQTRQPNTSRKMADNDKKIKQVRKTMDKTENNICKSALVAGQNTCAGEDLLNECKEWCNKLNIRCVTMGTDPIPANARADDFKL